MLSSVVRSILNLLSIVTQSDSVFVYHCDDAAPTLSAETLPTLTGKQMRALTFQQLAAQFACATDPASSPETVIRYTPREFDKPLELENGFSLFIAGLWLNASSSQRPDCVLGMCLASNTVLNCQQQQGIASVAELIKVHTKQSLKLTSLGQSEMLFKEISGLNKDFIYVKDADGKVIFANRAVVDLFPGSNYEQVIKQKLVPFFEQRSADPIADAAPVVAHNGEHQYMHHVKQTDGTTMVLQTVTQRFSSFQDAAYLLVVSRNITEREVIIKDLKRSNKDLDNFAYVASHDLKAPLNVIKRLVSWVMEDSAQILPRDCLENLELVMSRANRMEQLLQDLLAYSRIGKEYQEATEVNVKSKVVEMLSLIDLPMGFVVNCDDAAVKVPEVPFGVVLLNLIANAIKHHDSGNAKIQIKVRRNQTSNVITVIDNGPGIAKDNRARIFDIFETLKPRDEVEGSGMGLSVVKRLVEHYGGQIKVDDNRPRGTKFVVYWPFNNMARQVLTQFS